MSNNRLESGLDLNRHILLLGHIYTFLGWLGLFGSALLLFSNFASGPAGSAGAGTGMFGMSQAFSAFLLVCWSILLLNFARDLTGKRKWSTGICGFCIGLLNLLSVPIGTAVGTYTLWILFMNRRLH